MDVTVPIFAWQVSVGVISPRARQQLSLEELSGRDGLKCATTIDMSFSLPSLRPSAFGSRSLLALAAILAACGCVATLVDLPVARFLADTRRFADTSCPADTRSPAGDGRAGCSAADVTQERTPRGSRRLPGDLIRIVNLSEVFGYSPSAAIILLAALLLDPSLVRPTPSGAFRQASRGRATFRVPAIVSADAIRMVGMTFTGGLTTDLLKLIITRVRPYAANLDLHAKALDTFSNIEGVSGVAMRSFPSGHAAVAAGLASALCWRYPRGAALFVAIAAAAAAQRLTSSSHYLSDVAVGAAIAVAWAAVWSWSSERKNPY